MRVVRKDTASKPCSHYRWQRWYKFVSVLMSVDLRWPPAKHLTSSSCLAATMEPLACKNGPLKSVRVLRKDTASKPCSQSRLGRYYNLVSVLMSFDLRWLLAPHLTSSSCVAAAILHYRHKNGPLKSVRIMRKGIASKPCSHYWCWRCYSVVSVLMRWDFGWPLASHLTS